MLCLGANAEAANRGRNAFGSAFGSLVVVVVELVHVDVVFCYRSQKDAFLLEVVVGDD